MAKRANIRFKHDCRFSKYTIFACSPCQLQMVIIWQCCVSFFFHWAQKFRKNTKNSSFKGPMFMNCLLLMTYSDTKLKLVYLEPQSESLERFYI